MATTLLDHEPITRDEPPATPRPLSLSDAQMDAVLRAATPLQLIDRAAFLVDVAAALSTTTIGDGAVHRIVRETQRKYLRPPDLSRGKDCSRWRR